MDSGTSGGSMQSGSSGEDDQNDTSFSPALPSNPNLHHLSPQTHLHQPYFSSQHPQYPPLPTTMSFYPTGHPHLASHNSSFLESLPQSDLDRIWSMGMNAHPQTQQQQQQHQMFYSAAPPLAASPSAPSNVDQTTQYPQLKQPGKSTSPAAQPGKENGSSSGRVVKKRTRASRKTPTTVLTTDTANFRAMVQEFTGIPTPPFGPSALFPSKKFDLFGQNNGLDPSLGSLLYTLNKSSNHNPNPNPFAPPLINPFARNPTSNSDPYQQHHSQQMMLLPPSGSNLYSTINPPLGQNQNPNLGFQSSSAPPLRPPFPSKYSAAGSKSGNEVDQRGENDNNSGTG